ncbi:alpha/beta fold hydrolase [Blastomonas fulva]|uniref:alpha/beta fold hydrolase n=1 Tax=Blastomonas fulva TaxID=1550728 RepID=UPI003F730AA7
MAQLRLMLRKGYADIAAGQVHYRYRPGSGHAKILPVVFLHQTASSGAMWEKVMARWSRGQPLYALDTPGFGGSFDPDEVSGLGDYARWIAEACDGLGLTQFHLIGHHTGAGIALEMANMMPDRVRSLALVGPSCLTGDERAAFAARLGKAFRPVRSGAYLLKTWEYLRIAGADADIALLHREMIDTLRAWNTRPDAYAAAWAQDGTALIARLACPTIAIAARDDILHPYLHRVGDLRPDIECVTLEAGANFEPDLAADTLTATLEEHISKSSSA